MLLRALGTSESLWRSAGARVDERAATGNFSWSLLPDVNRGHKICTSTQRTIDSLSNGDHFVGLHPSETLLQLLNEHRERCLDVHRLGFSHKRLQEHVSTPLGTHWTDRFNITKA